uniref:Zinc finger CCHC domain-containing protein 7-like isoform X2 n=1 Tax=Cicer arietinum TaxID=3827 RepID=A0A1S2XNQ0_CICAR|nr:zinc finger CCHC domain-containing protein 7-like isoform X2 [Cicer arietinum]
MGTKKKSAKKIELEEDAADASITLISDDDDEANKDLSLEIVQKALLSRATNPQNDAVLNVPTVIAASKVQLKEKKKKKKKKKLESEIETVNVVEVEEEEKEDVEKIKAPEKEQHGEAETGMVDPSDNVVLRKLLRGPRYFDPPSDSVWGTCFNCGEEGHASFNCTVAKRKKPCFVCGSLIHNVKKCTMARYCSKCKIVGHRTKDCDQEKHTWGSNSKSLTICLRCGNSGHDMFLCKNNYSQDDLKEIQCYVCKNFGHLCCVNTTDATPNEFSCYKCGQMGHIGLACSRLQTENTTNAATPSSCYKCGEKGHFARECSSSVKTNSRWQPETTDPATPSSCYRCGEEGHFSRECSSSVKVGNRKHKLSSTETPRFQKENSYMGYRSAPHESGEASKKIRPHEEESDIKTPKKSKYKGGWMTEHPGEFSTSNSKREIWRSPVSPHTKNHFFNNGSLSSKSFKMRNDHDYDGTPNSGGSARSFHHRYSASRFGNASSDGFERIYNRW